MRTAAQTGWLCFNGCDPNLCLRLGNWLALSDRSLPLGRNVQAATAGEFVAAIVPIIQAIRSAGAVTLRDMTAALNQRGIRSARW
jgi:hypothetical protein